MAKSIHFLINQRCTMSQLSSHGTILGNVLSLTSMVGVVLKPTK